MSLSLQMLSPQYWGLSRTCIKLQNPERGNSLGWCYLPSWRLQIPGLEQSFQKMAKD